MIIDSSAGAHCIVKAPDPGEALLTSNSWGDEQVVLEDLKNGDEIYLIYSEGSEKAIGYVIATDYRRMEHAREIILHTQDSVFSADEYICILNNTIRVLSRRNGADFLILKVRDTLDELARAAEATGFVKEGLFISNQFLQGEFTYYSVYQYKLK